MKFNIKIISRVVGILFLITAIGLGVNQYIEAENEVCQLPQDTVIGAVNLSGLQQDETEKRLKDVYLQPIQILVGDTFFYVDPTEIGFTLNTKEMVNEAFSPCLETSPWEKMIKGLFSQETDASPAVELSWTFDSEKLFNYVNQELRPRYDQSTNFSYPEPGTTQYIIGNPGREINYDLFQEQIVNAFLDPKHAPVMLPFEEINSNPLTDEMLIYQINQAIREQGFTGVVELYVSRPSDQHTLSFAVQNQQTVQPGIAFTAASTMKIPILLSFLGRTDLPLSDLQQGWLDYMIIYSENDPADRLMEQIDYVRGPLVVTEDMERLGLENTFIAGYFYLGAPLLNLYQTPANQRADINLGADLYNQTTPEEIGNLLSLIYDCAEHPDSELVREAFYQINQEKCQLMLNTLSQNKIGALIESGVPEGIRVAHKHGWSEEPDGLIHTFSDVGIVYGEEEDYVFTIFIYSPNQLLFDTANLLTAQISQSVYNFMNPDHQILWINPY